MEKPDKSDDVPVADRQPNGDNEEPQRQTLGSNPISSESVNKQETSDQEYQYVTGFKLAVVIGSVTMVCFLLFLDLSIIATVSQVSVCYFVHS